jgi:hypothetical protein
LWTEAIDRGGLFPEGFAGLENGFVDAAEYFVRKMPARNVIADTVQTGPSARGAIFSLSA